MDNLYNIHFISLKDSASFSIWALLGNFIAIRYPRDLKDFIGPVWAIFQLTTLLKQNPGVTSFYPGIYNTSHFRIFITNVVGQHC